MLRQGLTILTWSSLTLESFFQEVDSVLDMFNQLLKKVYRYIFKKLTERTSIKLKKIKLYVSLIALGPFHLQLPALFSISPCL